MNTQPHAAPRVLLPCTGITLYILSKIKSVIAQFYCGITPATVKLQITLFEWGLGPYPQNMQIYLHRGNPPHPILQR